jgi:lysophospholipase L1-like esterase
MTTKLPPFTPLGKNERIIFFGDSVTAAERNQFNIDDIGFGYVKYVLQALQQGEETKDVWVKNAGVDGDTIRDLQARLKRDVLPWYPSVVSILIGVNDCFNTLMAAENVWGEPVGLIDFRRGLESILEEISTQTDARVVLMEPYVVPEEPEQWSWHKDLSQRITIIRHLAREYGALLVPCDGLMNAAACTPDRQLRNVTQDGVHPTTQGHLLLADSWLTAVPR